MKRKFLSIFAIILIFALASIVVACDSTSNSGSGNYGGNYNPNTSTYSCSHSWSEATCESPSKCSKCGKTSGSSLGHDWEDATCETPKTCQRCQETSGEVLDHNYVDGVCSMCEQLDPETEQLGYGTLVYLNLNLANSTTADVASAVYNAWYFAVYKANDYSGLSAGSAVAAFASQIGIKKEIVVETIDAYLISVGYEASEIDNITRLVWLDDINFVVKIALNIYRDAGQLEIIENCLASAKDLLKDMSNEYDDVTNYSQLKEYYSDSLAYYNFVKSPSGSFSQLASTLNGHTSKLVEHKNDLSFIYTE